MGLASVLLIPKDSEIMQSQSLIDLRIYAFHALVVVSKFRFFLLGKIIIYLL